MTPPRLLAGEGAGGEGAPCRNRFVWWRASVKARRSLHCRSDRTSASGRIPAIENDPGEGQGLVGENREGRVQGTGRRPRERGSGLARPLVGCRPRRSHV